MIAKEIASGSRKQLAAIVLFRLEPEGGEGFGWEICKFISSLLPFYTQVYTNPLEPWVG